MSTLHQSTFSFDDIPAVSPTPILSLYSDVVLPAKSTVRDRLLAELESIERKKAKLRARQMKLRQVRSKLDRRAEMIGWQLESIARNPLAILRYSASQVPEHLRGDLWLYRPISDLNLERIAGLSCATYEMLAGYCPTIGDLEILRIHDGLTSIPRVGKRKAERIEQVLLNWLAHNAFGYVPAASYEHRALRVADSGKVPAEIVL